jgi:Transglutaminase-like superfamily
MTDPARLEQPSQAAKLAYRRRLSPPRRIQLAVEIVAAYGHARWALRRGTLAEAVAALRGSEPAARYPDGDQLLTGIRLGRSVSRALGALPADSRCLVRSLTLTRLLASRGIQSSLVLGVRTEPRFEAHAWVECAGVALLPPADDTYGRLVEL